MIIERADQTPDPIEVLQRYRNRQIRYVLERMPDDGAEPIIAVFRLVYQGSPAVDHSVAVAVANELTTTQKSVGDLIDGWRPSALSVPA